VAEFPHPDLIQSGVKQATQGNRYQFYAGACYLLYASTAAMQGASGLTVKFFTNENPDADGGDELKAVLPAPSIREDAPDLYFPHGLYIEVEGVNGNSDVALVEANWVARADYCRAYPQVAETLTKCWSETRPDDPFLSKFDEGAPDDGDWDNEGAAGSGGVSGAPKVSIFTTNPTVNDDSAAGYSAGDLWVNSTDDTVFVLADATAGAAVWTQIGTGGGSVEQALHYTHHFHQGASTYNTAQEFTMFTARADMTIAAIYVSTTKPGGTGTSSATNYWEIDIFNGGSVSGSSLFSGTPFRTHDGVDPNDLSDNLDSKDLGVDATLSVPAGNIVSLVIRANSNPGLSQNSEQWDFTIYYTLN